MNRAIGAARERFAQHLGRACRTGGADDHLAAVRLAEAERLLERVGVGLVQLPARVLLTNGAAVLGQPRLPLARGNLLDADGNFHGSGCTVQGALERG